MVRSPLSPVEVDEVWRRSLFVQARGDLRHELSQHLRARRAMRRPVIWLLSPVPWAICDHTTNEPRSSVTDSAIRCAQIRAASTSWIRMALRCRSTDVCIACRLEPDDSGFILTARHRHRSCAVTSTAGAAAADHRPGQAPRTAVAQLNHTLPARSDRPARKERMASPARRCDNRPFPCRTAENGTQP
jgi:hypothetical protein